MNDRRLLIFGTGEIAEVASFYFGFDGDRDVAAFVVDDAFVEKSTFNGLPVVARSEVGAKFSSAEFDIFVAIGYSKLNSVRQSKCAEFRLAGYELASYISPRATVYPNSSFGENVFILEDNTIQPFVKVGNGVTLWSGNHLGHHASIGDFAFISSHVVISGGVVIGERTFIGVNSTLNDHISVGARCVIGSGCLVTKNVDDEGVLTAEPAKLSPVPSRRLRSF